MIIERKRYIQQLLNSRHNGLVKIITGIRRCGKSFLLFNLFKRQLKLDGVDKEHIIEMAFDDFGNKVYRDPDKFYQYVKSLIKDGRMYYILLDEVQMLKDFEDVLNGLLHIPNADVYVTGSNAKFLSKDIITEFRGRGYQIHISPLSFSEFMSVYQGSQESGWVEYLQYGGLPPVILQPTDEDKIRVLKDLWQETYLIDILNRNRIKNNAELEELLCMLSSGIGGLVNPQKLSNTFKTNKNISIGSTNSENIHRLLLRCLSYRGSQEIRREGKKIYRYSYEVLLHRLRTAQCTHQFSPNREDPSHGECDILRAEKTGIQCGCRRGNSEWERRKRH